MLSVIVPCYNEEKTIEIFYEKISKLLPEFCDSYEIIFVDDGSTDTTLEKIKTIQDGRVRYLSLSRNFGKEGAILAGFENAKGDYITLLDVDMQDPVELLPKMYKAVTEEGYDFARARRASRNGEPVFRSWCTNMFYLLVQKVFKLNIELGARDYGLMKRDVLNAYLSIKDKTRFTKGIFPFIGFKVKQFDFENVERYAGETKYSFWGLVRYALEGITVFSNLPLVAVSFTGMVLFVVGVIASILILLTQDFEWQTVTASIVMLFLGIQMLFFSILAQYMIRIYTESKDRPLYIIREQS